MNAALFPAVAVLMTVCVARSAFAGEPDFGDPAFYGRLNVTLEHARVEGASAATKFVDNGSRLGFRGGREFGSGHSASFQVEGRLRNDPDGWVVKSRDTWVGLESSSFGAARLGMMEGPLFHATYDEISMHNHNSGRSEDKLLTEGAIGGRMSKSVYYRAPPSGPLKIELLHAFLTKDPKRANASNPSHDEFALTFESGESWVAGGYAESRNIKVDKAWTLAGSARVSSVVLAALYERSATTPLAGPTAARNYGRIAAKYPMGKHEFHINLGVAGNVSSVVDSGATQATLGYNYNITGQTKLYAFATRIGNQRNASYSFLDNTGNGANDSSLALGVRHNF